MEVNTKIGKLTLLFSKIGAIIIFGPNYSSINNIAFSGISKL